MIKFKNVRDRVAPGEVFLAILFVALFLLFLFFGLSLHSPHISLPFKISSACADSSLIVMVCMFLKGKWRFIGVGAAFITGWLLLANLLYFRNFEDLIQASSYLRADIGDPTITGGAISTIRLSDLAFLLLPFFPLAYLLWKRLKVFESPVKPICKLSIAVLCLFSWSVSYAGVFRRMRIYYPTYSFKELTETIFNKDVVAWRNDYEMHGFTGYAAKCFICSFNIGMDLTPEDVASIRSHIAGKARHRLYYTSDSTELRKPLNLIMIVVESLPFKVIERPEFTGLIPTISEAIRDSSTIVSKCSILADYGRSSDAQFIYNTGLLPLRHEALVDNYAFNNYPSLAKALPYASMEIIGENKGLWVHSLTTKSYGFATLIDNIAPRGMDQDSLIFKRAEMEVLKLPTPFFLFITSISMHDPYDIRIVTNDNMYDIVAADDSRDREYYARLSHFDKSLGRFLSELKRSGIYDDSVIVILGDHEIRSSKISSNLHDDSVPFIILNSPLKSKRGFPTTQLDVFPSLLDIAGIGYRYMEEDYSGLGQSIFSEKAEAGDTYTPTDKDYEISEMIIKGRPAL